uniref:Aminotransferase-like protein n=1 Tax=Oryza sativa subsp. japonica TaxID=39947 RepID=Q6Z0C2_ORYSJ|nr:aminotransferase-like protein [Oryza sativa Japonica Group]
MEEVLAEEEIEEAVDEAAAELSEAREQTPPADIPAPQRTPPTPIALARQTRPASSEHTPSAASSHNVEEEVQAPPTITVLADMFSFDIRQYFDEEEEDTTSKALAPLTDDVKRNLQDISTRLEASLDVLQHQFKLEKARQRIADRRERKDIEATIQANRLSVNKEKARLDQLSIGPVPIQSNIDRLESRRIEVLAQLEECNTELALKRQKLADLPKVVEEQKLKLKATIRNVADLTKSLKFVPGTDAQDEVEQIRQRAISAIQRYLAD